jgi:pimeloyl-ACP methyl ester carboxylesterase
MTAASTAPRASRGGARRWIRRAFLLWALVSTLWLANSYRTHGVDEALLQSDAKVFVADDRVTLAFRPAAGAREIGLVFICGSGVAAAAYAPLLRPVAEAGYPVFIVKLPWRFAPFRSQKDEALARARRVMQETPGVAAWALAGHSLGAALAARAVHADASGVAALVLIGTTHPRDHDLSSVRLPVTKIYGTNDGVAPHERSMANSHLLPADTRWVAIDGGNHSQFGHYGWQLLDGRASIGREAQQAAARAALLDVLGTARP